MRVCEGSDGLGLLSSNSTFRPPFSKAVMLGPDGATATAGAGAGAGMGVPRRSIPPLTGVGACGGKAAKGSVMGGQYWQQVPAKH